MTLSTRPLPRLMLVSAVNQPEVLQKRLAASPCLRAEDGLPQRWVHDASSAAAAFNPVMEELEILRGSAPGTPPTGGAAGQPSGLGAAADWLVWAHQDVYLPQGWDFEFGQALAQAHEQWPHLAVAGVYGVRGHGDAAIRAGRLLDRGEPLHEAQALPTQVDSLDELLLAVRVGSGLRMEPALAFDFYATDLVLQARARGLCAAVVAGYCEHWSALSRRPPLAAATAARLRASGAAFERKWQGALPLTTPCFRIDRPGDVAAAVEAFM